MKKLRGLLKRGAAAAQPAQPGVHVACFGKHPGWDDHMDHLGVDTEHLTEVWQRLYQDGVQANLDRGAWAKDLPDEHRLPGFAHEFLWQAGDTIDAGLMWASKDRKGRADYPMIACVSAVHVGLDWVCREAQPVLNDLRKACIDAPGSEGVVAAVAGAQDRLRAVLPDGPAESGKADPGGALARLATLPPFEAEPEQFVRLIYHIERECGLDGERSGSVSLSSWPAQHLRVPGLVEDTMESLRLWISALGTLASGRPIFVCRASGRDWVDVAMGNPGVDEVFALLATPAAVPMVTSIPYEIDETDRKRILALRDPPPGTVG